MRFDYENWICSAQAFTGAATVSENAYDLGDSDVDPSIGELMCMVIYPTVAAGAGSTHTMEVVQADNAALTSNLEVLATSSIAAADLTVGSQHIVPIPQGVVDKRYLGFRNTSTGGTTTITADVYYMPLKDVPKFKTFPKVVDAEV